MIHSTLGIFSLLLQNLHCQHNFHDLEVARHRLAVSDLYARPQLQLAILLIFLVWVVQQLTPLVFQDLDFLLQAHH